MKLNIKNLKGEVFQVEVEPADNIATLKNKIQEAKSMPAESLKIVFKGKTVNNQDTIEKLAIKETDFIVVMSQVAKPAPKPKEETKPQPPKQQKAEEKKDQKKEEKKQTQPQSQPQQNQLNAAQEAQINELISMGFPRQQCLAALRAAFFNTERAVQYLLNGIPAGLDRQPQPAQQGGQGQSLGSGELGVSQLRALFSHPNFAQLRDLIRSNPAALQPILAQISQSSPQIYNLIAQHPQEFERIIQGGGEDDMQGEQGLEGDQPPPGTIMITAADEAAINRLRQLGFSKIEAAQAYFACDKNEQLAANLLFDRLANGDIEMEPQGPLPGGNQGGQSGQGGQGGQGGAGKGAEDDDDNLFN